MKEGFLALDYHIKVIVEPSTVYILELINKFQVPVKAGASLGFVLIKSDPSGAEVTVNGEVTGAETPFQKPLQPGQYSYSLSKQLYKTYSGTFIITAGKTTTVENKLVANFGSLSIQTQPEGGADIYLDDKLVEEKSPTVLEQLPTGSHTVVIKKKLFESITREIEIQSGQTFRLDVSLQPTFGEINITALTGVEIWIDQQQVGTGSYTGRLLKGVHLIEAKKQYHYDFSETVTVEVGKTHTENITLIPRTGILTIMSDPPEAKVILDGINKGKTPLILEEVLIGPHTLLLTKKGHQEIRRQFELQEQKTFAINETLPKVTEKNIVATTPSSSVLNKPNRKDKPLAMGTFTDTRDNQTYKWVKIGNQVWMAENLNYHTGESWCYDQQKRNCKMFGRLYSREVAKNSCPKGWHLPNNEEWIALTDFLGGKDIAGGKMKESGTNIWSSPNTGATNSSGFSALPSGYRSGSGAFFGLLFGSYFWSSTKASGRKLSYDIKTIYTYSFKTSGASLRCIKD